MPDLPNNAKEGTLYELVDLLRDRRHGTGLVLVWVLNTLKDGAWLELDYTAALNWVIDAARRNDGKVSYRTNGEGELFLGCGDCLETWTTPR